MINKLFIAAVLLVTVSVGAAETSVPEEVKRLELLSEKSPTETIILEFDTPVSLTADQRKEIEWFLDFSLKANLRFIRLEVLDSGGKVRFRCDTPGNISHCDAAGKPAGNAIVFSVMSFSEPGANGKKLRLYGLNYEIVEGMPEWEKVFPETLKKIEELNKADFKKPPVKLLSVKKTEDFFAETKKLKTDMTLNEVIAILGPPDRIQTPSPKKLLPSGPVVTVRYLYYYLYRIGYSPSPEEIFVVLQLDYPDYPSRRRTALKALYMDDEAHYILNTAVPAHPRGSGNRDTGVRNYVVEKAKISLPEPRRIQVDGKTTAIRSDFLQSFQSLEYLKITDTSKEGVIQVEDVKCASPLKILVLNKGVMNTMSPQQPGEARSTMIKRIQKPEIAERIIVNSTSLFFL